MSEVKRNSENSIYSVAYFINKFEAIKEEDWCVNKFRQKIEYPVKEKRKLLGIIPYVSTRCETKTNYCAQGHCMGEQAIDYVVSKHKQSITHGQIAKSYPEWNALINIFGWTDRGVQIIARINNGDDPRYQQPTPRQRVLKALYDIKAEQASQAVPEKVIGEIVKKLKKDLILN